MSTTNTIARPLVHRLTGGRPRLVLSALGGVAIFLALPGGIHLPTRILLAWNAGILGFLALTAVMMAQATPERMRSRAQLQDNSRWVILALTIGATLSSLFSIGAVLNKAKDAGPQIATLSVALAGTTIFLSWIFAHCMFALHYAHEYYGDARQAGKGARTDAGGLDFPGGSPPDYWDFLYFSLVVGMTCQVSDVQVTRKPMRRLTLAHGVISFLFNTVILALSINIAASLL